MIDCALFEPDIPQNAGAILRLGACFGAGVHVIHPTGFALSDRAMRRAGMDYLDRAVLVEHRDWAAFAGWRQRSARRLLAMTTHGRLRLPDFAFRPDDVLLFGRESAGLPDDVRCAADAAIRIPIRPGNRSLNIAAAAAIALYEALRQTGRGDLTARRLWRPAGKAHRRRERHSRARCRRRHPSGRSRASSPSSSSSTLPPTSRFV